MSYYTILGLDKEPFSTSPDPLFFYRSLAHDAALKRLEIAIRLRRGLSLIMGDVGTGKTTLSRALLQAFDNDDGFIFHIILDPNYKSEFQFLTNLVKTFGIEPVFKSTLDYKEAIERYLFKKGVEENKTVVLLVDEGQKLGLDHLEILRILLNYETNEYKLLQLVILAQVELLPKVRRVKNFMDRIALKYMLNPLDEKETRGMIEFRLEQAGYMREMPLFTDEAIKLIYEYSQGYPRKIAIFCHDALELIVMKEQYSVDKDTIQELIQSDIK